MQNTAAVQTSVPANSSAWTLSQDISDTRLYNTTDMQVLTCNGMILLVERFAGLNVR
jgi:hypothetical protein